MDWFGWICPQPGSSLSLMLKWSHCPTSGTPACIQGTAWAVINPARSRRRRALRGLHWDRGSCNKCVKINWIHVYIWYICTFGQRQPCTRLGPIRCEGFAAGSPFLFASPSSSPTPQHTKHSSQPGLPRFQMGIINQRLAPVLCRHVHPEILLTTVKIKPPTHGFNENRTGKALPPHASRAHVGMRCVHAGSGCHATLSNSCSRHGMSIFLLLTNGITLSASWEWLIPSVLSTRERLAADAPLLFQRESSSSSLTPFSPLSENTFASEWALHWKSYICQNGITFVKLVSSS